MVLGGEWIDTELVLNGLILNRIGLDWIYVIHTIEMDL